MGNRSYTKRSVVLISTPNYTKRPVVHANHHGENKPIVVQQLSHIQVGHDEMHCSLPPIQQTGGAPFDPQLQQSVRWDLSLGRFKPEPLSVEPSCAPDIKINTQKPQTLPGSPVLLTTKEQPQNLFFHWCKLMAKVIWIRYALGSGSFYSKNWTKSIPKKDNGKIA